MRKVDLVIDNGNFKLGKIMMGNETGKFGN